MEFAGKVSNEWLSRGVWLAEAAIVFADSNTELAQRMMAEGAKQFTALRHGESPETFALNSLRSEAEHDQLLHGDELTAWRKYSGGLGCLQLNLIGRLQFGTLLAFGVPDRLGAQPEWIPPWAWMHLELDTGCRNKASGEGGTYWQIKVVDPALALVQGQTKAAAPSPVTKRLEKASPEQLDVVIGEVYATSENPPNLAKLYTHVQGRLEKLGLRTTKREVEVRGRAPKFSNARNLPGPMPKHKALPPNSSQTSRREN